MPIALLGHVTFWTDLTKLTPEQQAETAWWIRWYSTHRNAIGPAMYELTVADPIDGASWAAWESWNGTSGYVFAFRQSAGPGTQVLRLAGVHAGAAYTVIDVRTGSVYGTFTGAQLASGLPVPLDPNSAVVFSVRPAR